MANATMPVTVTMIDKYDMYERQERAILLAIQSRHKSSLEDEDGDVWFGDADCITDDMELNSECLDIVCDHIADLKHEGFVVEFRGGLLACTDKGWHRANEIIKENQEAYNNV